MYAEVSGMPGAIGSLRSGVAIANAGILTVTATLELTELDGTPIGLGATRTIAPSGQVAAFIDELFPALTGPFQGVLRVTSTPSAVAVIGLRSRTNQRGDFMITTTPPTDEAGPSTMSELVFPHLADTGGWTTQFVLFSGIAGQTASGTMSFVSDSGQALPLVVR